MPSIFKDYAGVTPEVIQQLAARYLVAGRAWRLAVLPQGAKLAVSAGDTIGRGTVGPFAIGPFQRCCSAAPLRRSRGRPGRHARVCDGLGGSQDAGQRQQAKRRLV